MDVKTHGALALRVFGFLYVEIESRATRSWTPGGLSFSFGARVARHASVSGHGPVAGTHTHPDIVLSRFCDIIITMTRSLDDQVLGYINHLGVRVKALRLLLSPFRGSNARFDRYYGGIIRSGSGYPTADEARSDLRRRDISGTDMIGWLR